MNNSSTDAQAPRDVPGIYPSVNAILMKYTPQLVGLGLCLVVFLGSVGALKIVEWIDPPKMGIMGAHAQSKELPKLIPVSVTPDGQCILHEQNPEHKTYTYVLQCKNGNVAIAR